MPIEERLMHIRSAGFDGVMLWWGGDSASRRYGCSEVKKNGLIIDHIHASVDDLNSLWLDGKAGDERMTMLMREIYDCAVFGVSTIAVHLTNGISPPAVNPIGLRRIERLIDLADEYGIKLAFENVRNSEHVRSVLDSFIHPNVCLCWDSGHEHLWTPEIDLINLYSQRIAAVHLHDNDGNADSHLIPGDGNINWDVKIFDLSKSSYSGSIMLEAEYHSDGKYTHIEYNEFLHHAYIKALSIAKLLNGNINND